MSTTRLLIVHARSPLHAGTGQATAAVDLPIARDRATEMPFLPGSSIKGALRARARGAESALKAGSEWAKVFGPETANASDHAGAVAISDARLLLLPVRSVAGTFAWVTSPYLLAAFARDAAQAGLPSTPSPKVPSAEFALVAKGTLIGLDYDRKEKVVLEEFDLNRLPGADELADKLAPIVFPDDAVWQDLLKRRLCVVHDDVMSFLSQHATEIVTRVSINPETGTAKDGQLWTEENLPSESVLVSLVEELPVKENRPLKAGAWLDLVQKELLGAPIQLGGKATVGRGRCKLHLTKGGK